MKVFLLSFVLFSLFSCSEETVPKLLPVEPTPTPDRGGYDQLKPQSFSVVGEYGTQWHAEWTQLVFDALDIQNSSLLEDDLNLYDLRKVNCSNYNVLPRLDKKKFWALFMASISYFESSFNPAERYWESSMGKYSEGLLQLSIDDSDYYDFCELNRTTILNPENNLSCGMSVMAKQISGSKRRPSGELFPKSMFYWSVLTRVKMKNKVITFFNKRVNEIIPSCF
ncbi:hypothetical protein A9Q84_04820 [Halobacteriovorax marinus]|uniref:Transglycosylase SLT domain-containing protein n=1 Tax=Halobacteriovorax marinus TaxID=97084 RepID=A0A1Y5FAP0_9BACT|nr:hypothetical protein A9Q84_04820 [Halobacteriovorax marinus]